MCFSHQKRRRASGLLTPYRRVDHLSAVFDLRRLAKILQEHVDALTTELLEANRLLRFFLRGSIMGKRSGCTENIAQGAQKAHAGGEEIVIGERTGHHCPR